MSIDVLPDVLRTIRLRGTLFLDAELREPRCFEAPRGAVLARPKVPELTRMRYGGSGDRTLLVCGWFAYEGDLPNPLTDALAPLFRTAVGRRPAGPWIEQSIRYALDEAALQRPGAEVMAAKVAEVLFVETLRGYLESLPASQDGWLRGLRDPQVGQALALLHAEPARQWTVEELAAAVHMSRSAFANSFTQRLGAPPMQYLTRWRMTLAAGYLRNGHDRLGRIAEAVGYASEAAFNRAFRRAHGTSPGAWRTQAGEKSTEPAAGE